MPNISACPYAKKCGGCQLQNMDYERQLRYKQGKVIKFLGRYHRVEPILGMEHPYHYRNKVQAAFGLTRSRRIVSGVYQASSHTIVNVDKCLIEDEIADAIIVDIRRMLPDQDLGYICTFHSFSVTLLREECHFLQYPKTFFVMDNLDKTAMLEESQSVSPVRTSAPSPVNATISPLSALSIGSNWLARIR